MAESRHMSPRRSEIYALEQRGYVLGKKIGQGSYAMVHVATYTDRSTTRSVQLACKIFDKAKAPSDFLEKFFPREIEILTNVDSPHIIQIHSILQRGPKVYIFMRYADNGDLLDFVKHHGATEEINAKTWFRQIVGGLNYLHTRNIAHRDLKCENILLSHKFNVKIADFGFARLCVDIEGRRVLSHTYCGSAAYAAPEVVSGTPYNPKLADVWSLGVILYIMLNASMPFDDSNLRKLLKDQLTKNWSFKARLRSKLSDSVQVLVHRILEPDITRRLTLDRVISNDWVKRKLRDLTIPHDLLTKDTRSQVRNISNSNRQKEFNRKSEYRSGDRQEGQKTPDYREEYKQEGYSNRSSSIKKNADKGINVAAKNSRTSGRQEMRLSERNKNLRYTRRN